MVTPENTPLDRMDKVIFALFFGIALLILVSIFLIGFHSGNSGKKSLGDPAWRSGLRAKILGIIQGKPGGKCTIHFEEIGTHWENNYEIKEYGYAVLTKKECTGYKTGEEIFVGIKTYYTIDGHLP